jgi:tetratricopeptide (TPR) repeat protein
MTSMAALTRVESRRRDQATIDEMHKQLALLLMFTACATTSPQPQAEPASPAPTSSEPSIPVLGLELGLPERPSFVVPNLPALADDGSWSIRGLRSVRDELLRESEQGRVVVVTAYVQEIYQPPTCLPNQPCLAKLPHAWLVDDPSVDGKRLALMIVGTEFPIPEWDEATLQRFADAPELELEVGRRYAFMGWFRRQTESSFVHDQGLLELFATAEYPVVGNSEWVVPIGSPHHPNARAAAGLEPLRPERAQVPDSVRLGSDTVAANRVIEPSDAKHAYALGRDADEAGQPLEADYYFRWLIVNSPESADGWVSLAISYADHGEGEACVGILELAIERRPDNAHLYNGLGRLLSILERPQAATIAYRRALELDPKRPDALFGLGMAYAELGDWEQAIEALEHFLEVAADAPEHIRAAARDTILRMHQ